MGRPADARVLWIIGLLLVAVTAAAYWGVLKNDFVNYDDSVYVTQNPYIRDGLNGESLRWAFTVVRSSNWHPLTWVSHILDVQWYGLEARGHHLTSLILHLANTLLLFLLLRRMTGAVWRSAFVAALFGIHPLHVESVAWVAERKDVLSTLFLLLTVLAYVWYVESPGFKRYLPVVVLFALGLMAKPMLVTLPFVLLLLDWWPLERTRGHVSGGADEWRNGGKEERKKGRRREHQPSAIPVSGHPSPVTRHLSPAYLVIEKVPLFALALASCVVTFWAQRRGGAVADLQGFSIAVRFGNALVSYVKYIARMLWPAKLAAFYPHPGDNLPVWQALGAAAILALFTVLALKNARRRPYLAVGWLWYLGTLVPVIGLVQLSFQAMADRYTYVPLIGLFVVVAWGVPDLVANLPRSAGAGQWGTGRPEDRTRRRGDMWTRGSDERRKRRKEERRPDPQPSAIGHQPFRVLPSPALPLARIYALGTPAAISILVFSSLTYRQVAYWRNSITLFEHAIRVTRGNYTAHNNLGQALSAEGRFEEAIVHFRKALETDPDPGLAYNNLGTAQAELGQMQEAMESFRRSVESDPECVEGHTNLALGLMMSRQFDEAAAHVQKALDLDPDCAPAHLARGSLLVELSDFDGAVAAFREALRIKPDYYQAHQGLGHVYLRRHDWDAAVREFEEAIRIKPDLGPAHASLAIALFDKGCYPDAWREVRYCRERGIPIHPQLLQALSAKMPDPGP